MPAAQLIGAFIEHSLNHWLAQSDCQGSVPKRIQYKQLAVTITDLKLTLVFTIDDKGHVSVLNNAENSDVKLVSDLPTLQKLEQTELLTKLIKAGDLDIDGDVQIAQGFADYFKSSFSRWRDVLASLLGDVLSYKLESGLSKAKTELEYKVEQDKQALTNYIWNEAHIAPHPIELIDFSEQVKALRQDSDRIEARIKRLMQHNQLPSEA